MNYNQWHLSGSWARAACALGGVVACAMLGAMSATSDAHLRPAANYQAGSGDAPSNTTYVQPAVPAMTQGATATFTAPGSEPATTIASPTYKATPYG